MDSSFCVDALEEAIRRYGCPGIVNTDQGSHFTAEAFTGTLHSKSISTSMDGKDRWTDNVFIERLWKSVKYEDIYLRGWLKHRAFLAKKDFTKFRGDAPRDKRRVILQRILIRIFP